MTNRMPLGSDAARSVGGGSAWGRPAKAGLLRELGEQLFALLRAQAAHSTRRADGELFHDLAGADLPDARQRFENQRHLHLPDGVVVGLQHLLQREFPGLELALQLGASLRPDGRLPKALISLVRAQLRSSRP